MPLNALIIFSVATLLVTILAGTFASNLACAVSPGVQQAQAHFPSWILLWMVASIAATYLMVQKKVECWLAWLIADLVANGLVFFKGILFVGLEFMAFCVITVIGIYQLEKGV